MDTKDWCYHVYDNCQTGPTIDTECKCWHATVLGSVHSYRSAQAVTVGSLFFKPVQHLIASITMLAAHHVMHRYLFLLAFRLPDLNTDANGESDKHPASVEGQAAVAWHSFLFAQLG